MGHSAMERLGRLLPKNIREIAAKGFERRVELPERISAADNDRCLTDLAAKYHDLSPPKLSAEARKKLGLGLE